VTIFLVRHAHAGKRSEWAGDDSRRPLSPRGEQQSTGIADLLHERRIRTVLSSPYVRCVQTVEPLARKVGAAVEPDDRFAEGGAVGPALEALLALDGAGDHDGVACSHGDLIPLLLHELVARGMAVDGALLDQKGSVWSIDLVDGRPVRGTYTPPSA
jgi:8-oxo-dGTP diphosphatase